MSDKFEKKLDNSIERMEGMIVRAVQSGKSEQSNMFKHIENVIATKVSDALKPVVERIRTIEQWKDRFVGARMVLVAIILPAIAFVGGLIVTYVFGRAFM